MEDMKNPPHIAILPSPGMGHLIPLAEFAKRLVLHHNLSVTFISLSADSSSKAQKAILDAFRNNNNITSIPLPPIHLDDVPSDAKIETRISLTVERSLPALRDLLSSLNTTSPLSALVVDLFGTDAFDVARELGVPPFIFYPTTSTVLSFFLHLPELDNYSSCEFRHLSEPVKLPGCIPFHGKDLLDPVQDRKNDAYKWLLHHCQRYKEAEGILVNSFVDLEPGPIKALLLKEKEEKWPMIYPVGPLIQTTNSRDGGSNNCLNWLDQQPPGSVLFVSFGSGGTLSQEQLEELALGLEMSGHRFLWVARSPHQKESGATFFSVESSREPSDFLPEGFLSRTQGQGLVVASWAPQIEVLKHGSTGGFLSHCGWNSTLESITHGVPLIAWPLYAEQKMNALMLADDLGVALRPSAAEETGLVRREEIARVIKVLFSTQSLQGRRVRDRMQELKDAAGKALGVQGSSYQALSEVVGQWKKN
eukprot:TRINITY_DN36640_c0_g1_i1.p1 TRINITY_DN36640_c0_g1~~TRINITY_DN36640_c0_g1_i1.p1  ORF type:complete len:477 (+),score=84.61 TRINITY_DN36640_c0_g1_i1:1224-2654(+)